MIKRLLKSLREFKKPAFLTMFVMVGEVLMELLIPYVMASLIDDGFEKGDMKVIVICGVILLGCAVVSLTFGCLGSVFGAKAATGFARNLRGDLYRKVQRFSFSNIDKFSTSSVITRLTTDVARVQMAFGMSIRMAVRTPMMLIFSIVLTALISWKIALILLAIVPLVIGLMLLIMKVVMPVFKRLFKHIDQLNNNVQENVRGIRVVKAFVRKKFEEEKFNASSEDIYQDASKAEKLMAWNMPLVSAIYYLSLVAIAFVGTMFVVKGEPVPATILNPDGGVFTVGQLNSVFTYGMQILSSCMGFGMIFVMLMMAQESMRRIDEVLREEPTIKNPENPVMSVPDGSVVFDDVDFSYAGDMNKLCLMDVNLSIPAGATVGIIGGTGSSKSTLIQLIPRLYDVTGGRVLVGGTDVREYDMTALRDAVSVVLQKNTLFLGTIKENLRWGNPDATDEEMVHACRLAAADSFIMEFPKGYDTMIEQGGANVSGGQRQRLCIARALLKKPKILILDDSTSAVDTATDAMIRKSFREEIPDVTKIIIAQRISSVMDADMIIVLDNGRVNAVGTHEELIQNNAIYREVFESQQKGGENDGE